MHEASRFEYLRCSVLRWCLRFSKSNTLKQQKHGWFCNFTSVSVCTDDEGCEIQVFSKIPTPFAILSDYSVLLMQLSCNCIIIFCINLLQSRFHWQLHLKQGLGFVFNWTVQSDRVRISSLHYTQRPQSKPGIQMHQELNLSLRSKIW